MGYGWAMSVPFRRADQERCPVPECGAAVHLFSRHCPTCGADTGSPNVKLARAERPALAVRAQVAREVAVERGCAEALGRLHELGAASHATVAMGHAVLHELLSWDSGLYATYGGLLDGEARKPALPDDDRRRASVEGKLYGSGAAGQVRYAALSVDGSGLASYGPVSVRLKEVAVRQRATVLEENSFEFFERHGVGLLDPVPCGYLGTWEDRSEVVTAKLAGGLSPHTSKAELADALLRSAGDRKTDSFVEVHLWGPFDGRAIEAVRVMRAPTNRVDQVLAEAALHLAQQRGILWASP